MTYITRYKPRLDPKEDAARGEVLSDIIKIEPIDRLVADNLTKGQMEGDLQSLCFDTGKGRDTLISELFRGLRSRDGQVREACTESLSHISPYSFKSHADSSTLSDPTLTRLVQASAAEVIEQASLAILRIPKIRTRH